MQMPENQNGNYYSESIEFSFHEKKHIKNK